MLFEKIFQLEQVLDAFSSRCPPPSGKGRGSSLPPPYQPQPFEESGVRPDHFACRRVGDIEYFRGRRFMPGTAKIVLERRSFAM